MSEASRETLEASGEGADAAGSAAASGSSIHCSEHDWIEFVVVGEGDRAVPQEPIVVALADGALHEGKTDQKGRCRLDDVVPGECRVSFPDLDAEYAAVEEEESAAGSDSTGESSSDSSGSPNTSESGDAAGDSESGLRPEDPEPVEYEPEAAENSGLALKQVHAFRVRGRPRFTVRVQNELGLPLRGVAFEAELADGSVVPGETDDEGLSHIKTPPPGAVSVKLPEPEDLEVRSQTAILQHGFEEGDVPTILGVLGLAPETLKLVVDVYDELYNERSGEGLLKDIELEVTEPVAAATAEMLIATARLSDEDESEDVADEDLDEEPGGPEDDGEADPAGMVALRYAVEESPELFEPDPLALPDFDPDDFDMQFAVADQEEVG